MSKVQLRKKQLGGLHLALKTGDSIEIEHAGEKMTLIFVGWNGKDVYNVTAHAPLTFQIVSDKYKRLKQTYENPEVK